jgi:hypothetical protein
MSAAERPAPRGSVAPDSGGHRVAASSARGLKTIWRRWTEAGAWSRFAGAAVAVLVVGAALPDGVRIPGPSVPAESSTTSTVAAADRFSFSAGEFLVRWNLVVESADLGALARSEFDVADATHARFVIEEPAEGLSWFVTVYLDPASGDVTSAEFIAPLSEDGIEVVGALLFIAAIEGHSVVEMSAEVIDSLLDGPARDDGTYFDETATAAGRYALSMSPETQFFLRVVP